MNTNNRDENTEISAVEELVIDESWDVETIKEKTAEHNEKVKEWRTKVDENNKQLYARTKKAEGFELVDGKWVKPASPTERKPEATEPSKDKLNSLDVIAIMNSKVPEDDIEEVVEYATFKGISVAEALKSPIVKTLLAEKAEMRKTAEGANTNGGKRGNAKLSDELLLANARKGIYPESEEDMKRLTIIQRANR